jgi:hypothetical protein
MKSVMNSCRPPSKIRSIEASCSRAPASRSKLVRGAFAAVLAGKAGHVAFQLFITEGQAARETAVEDQEIGDAARRPSPALSQR